MSGSENEGSSSESEYSDRPIRRQYPTQQPQNKSGINIPAIAYYSTFLGAITAITGVAVTVQYQSAVGHYVSFMGIIVMLTAGIVAQFLDSMYSFEDQLDDYDQYAFDRSDLKMPHQKFGVSLRLIIPLIALVTFGLVMDPAKRMIIDGVSVDKALSLNGAGNTVLRAGIAFVLVTVALMAISNLIDFCFAIARNDENDKIVGPGVGLAHGRTVDKAPPPIASFFTARKLNSTAMVAGSTLVVGDILHSGTPHMMLQGIGLALILGGFLLQTANTVYCMVVSAENMEKRDAEHYKVEIKKLRISALAMTTATLGVGVAGIGVLESVFDANLAPSPHNLGAGGMPFLLAGAVIMGIGVLIELGNNFYHSCMEGDSTYQSQRHFYEV